MIKSQFSKTMEDIIRQGHKPEKHEIVNGLDANSKRKQPESSRVRVTT